MSIMNYFNKLRKYGIKHSLRIIWQIRFDWLIQDAVIPFVRSKPLEDIIIIESHNDFDCNGGTFYNYLIANGYNEKYKIVWLLKHPERKPNSLPKNVECYPLYAPSIKKDYRICKAKYLLADNVVTKKKRQEQVSIFLGHGTGGLKKVKGLSNIDPSCDYVLIQSEKYAPIQAEQYGLLDTPEKMVYIGYPIHDEILKDDRSELTKVTGKTFTKTILWMPTFRKSNSQGKYTRNDGTEDQKLGIPLIETFDEYVQINEFLKCHNMLLIIKIHPMQDISTLGIKDMTNIVVLTGSNVKEKGIDNYRLMRCTDALISDYSGAAYDYLQLDRPIGYVLNDVNDYKLGFVVEDIHTLIAGHEIYTLNDLLTFIKCISDDDDPYADKRHMIRDYIHKYHDTQNCTRLASFLKLKN